MVLLIQFFKWYFIFYFFKWSFKFNDYYEISNLIIQWNYILICFNEKTPFHIAIEKENIPLIQLLLSNDKVNVNTLGIFNFCSCNLKINISITFKIKNSNYIQNNILIRFII